MVPWHLQPHYSPGHDPTHSAKKKKEKRRRGKSKQSKTKTERGKDMEDIDDEKTDSSSHNKVVASSDLLRTPSPISLLMPTTSNTVEPVPSSKDNDFSVSSPHASSDDKHAFDLQQHGFRTFYRYYHVFVDKELIELCKRVPSLKILDYWYDHDNWCLLAQKLD
ncbi:PREDICTED: alkylated DNA repair protein alkB homolog 8-like [Amphimedon queenslandica]|nr:PREDICTED: alkylated DNA repair protein alkB homolog 8-like [Amphimedon queenslandica]|eukprot:XP_019862559.1 PREDICTED: alkylated DNA repair protein alkB homolog 8-like [Amphimedon queenslandica]